MENKTTSSTETLSAPLRRGPSKIFKDRPIALRLLPDEIERIKEIAHREQRSMANVCRLIVLRGLADYKQPELPSV